CMCFRALAKGFTTETRRYTEKRRREERRRKDRKEDQDSQDGRMSRIAAQT
ncbi:MAG: hypothetical protein AVDCRST_MAG56-5134, partial [uncultured Cytophagales bacterium]